MPLRDVDYNVANYINQLEERFEQRLAAIEARLESSGAKKSGAAAEAEKAEAPEPKESEAKQPERPVFKEPAGRPESRFGDDKKGNR